MHIGDIYQVTAHDNLIIVGVVSKVNDGSHFEGWELWVARDTGRLMSMSNNGRFAGPTVRVLSHDGIESTLKNRLDMQVKHIGAVVDRATRELT